MQSVNAPILGDGNWNRFALRREPNGIYRVDGRVIPVCDEGAEPIGTVDDRQSVVRVHNTPNIGVSLLGSVAGMNEEQR